MHFGTPHRLHLSQSFFYCRPRDVLYLNNAKAGCSTVKAAMLRGVRRDEGGDAETEPTVQEVHGNNGHWSQGVHQIGPATRSFTVVRNPYTRILSAYLDKIAKRNGLRFQFLNRYSMPLDTEVSFIEFLRRLDKNRHLAVADQHYRPQVENVYLGSVTRTRIFYLENFAQTAPDLCDWLDWDLPFRIRDSHGTGSRDKVASLYDDEAIEIIQRKFADDFRYFGYSTDVKDADEAPSRFVDHNDVDADARRHIDLASLGRDGAAARPKLIGRIGHAEPDLIDRLLLAEVGDVDHARLEADATAAFRPATGSKRLLIAQYLARRGEQQKNFEQARDYLREVILLCPYFGQKRYELALALIETGQLDAARAQRFALRHGSRRTELVKHLDTRLGPART